MIICPLREMDSMMADWIIGKLETNVVETHMEHGTTDVRKKGGYITPYVKDSGERLFGEGALFDLVLGG